jgi:tetratricopeptide (TPR) repeat protein
MRAGAWSRALLHLRPVAASEQLAAAPDLADVRARVLTLLAQALLERGDPTDHDEVERCLGEARELDPSEAARASMTDLQDRLDGARRETLERAAAEARTQRLADADIEGWLAKLPTGDRRCDLLVQKATAELDVGRSEQAAGYARRALALDDEATLRQRVMARLLMARTHPDRAEVYLQEALSMADAAHEFTLVGTIARTAELLGLELRTQVGPDTGRPR